MVAASYAKRVKIDIFGINVRKYEFIPKISFLLLTSSIFHLDSQCWCQNLQKNMTNTSISSLHRSLVILIAIILIKCSILQITWVQLLIFSSQYFHYRSAKCLKQVSDSNYTVLWGNKLLGGGECGKRGQNWRVLQ